MLNEQLLTANKTKKLGSQVALQELWELSRPKEPVSAVVNVPFYFSKWAGALFGCFGLHATSLQCFHSYISWKLLPLNKGNKQKQQGFITPTWLPCQKLLGGPYWLVPQVP